ncbi:uncharacterized protein LOC142879454 [Nelusetta ayraudi]|uniref:uncharacterized protein LOC142879454 n=1 Tax=Nelusetta ayraudi TaxID=303726 RepID=UPI003F6E68E1
MTAASSPPERGPPTPTPSSSSSSCSSSSPGCLRTCRRHLSGKGRSFHTRLPLRSAPGVWLLLGVLVVLVGMAVAVAGYVAAAAAASNKLAGGGGGSGGGRGGSHVERMKLAGPVVMGVGLFIFICAATLLFENRDLELLRRLHGPDDLDHLREGGDGWGEGEGEERGEGGGCWATAAAHAPPLPHPQPLPFPRGHIYNISNGPPSPPAEGGEEEGEGEGGRSTLLARVLHHGEPVPSPPCRHSPSPSPSSSSSPPSPRPSLHSDSCNSSNSSEVDFNTRTPSHPQH